MRNNIIKRRLEYSMLAGILFNFISLFIPIINLTLRADTKQYTEGYSVGSLVQFLVPAVLNGDKGELSNPPLSLMAFLLFGIICWLASLFTLVLVFQSMRAKNVNIFRTIAVSIFELLTALFFLVFSAQMKNFARIVAIDAYADHLKTSFNFLGLLPVLIVIAFSFINIYMLLGIIKRGEEYDEIDEEKDEDPAPRRPEGRRAPSSLYPNGRPNNPERPRVPRAPIERPAERPAERTNIYSGEVERPVSPEQRRPATRPAADPYRTRPTGSTGVIDRDHLPKPSASATRPTTSAPATVTCEKCGEKCRKGSRFCNICGEPLTPAVKKCKICGETLSERDVFCPSCGANIR